MTSWLVFDSNTVAAALHDIDQRCSIMETYIDNQNVLGVGGYGSVYPVEKNYVVKKVHINPPGPYNHVWSDFYNQCRRDKFLLEVALLQVATRNNIAVPMVGWYFCTDGGNIYGNIIMKKAEPWNPQTTTPKQWQGLISNIERMHRLRIWHHDLFPKNVMLYQNELRLIDFGLAIPKLLEVSRLQRMSDFFSLCYGGTFQKEAGSTFYRYAGLDDDPNPITRYILDRVPPAEWNVIFKARVINNDLKHVQSCEMEMLYMEQKKEQKWQQDVLHVERLNDVWTLKKQPLRRDPKLGSQPSVYGALVPMTTVINSWLTHT